MALETLKDVKEIDGFTVGGTVGTAIKEGADPILIDHEKNQITFQIQNGPIKENGVNGCQVDTLVTAAALIIEGLNAKFPCEENTLALASLAEAVNHLKARKINREARGVEGVDKA